MKKWLSEIDWMGGLETFMDKIFKLLAQTAVLALLLAALLSGLVIMRRGIQMALASEGPWVAMAWLLLAALGGALGALGVAGAAMASQPADRGTPDYSGM